MLTRVVAGAWEEIPSVQPPEDASLFWGGQRSADLLHEGGGEGTQWKEFFGGLSHSD